MIEWQKLVRHTGEEYINIFSEYLEGPLVVTSEHPNYENVQQILSDPWIEEKEQAEDIQRQVNMALALEKEFEKITDRVSVEGSTVYFDGDPIDNAIAKQMVRFLQEDVEDYKPLARFLEKLAQNPSQESREQLYPFLDKHDFTIAQSGDIVAYKGVNKNSDGEYVSVHAGPAIVDGKAVNGNVPNKIGSTVEIARSQVDSNSFVGCSTGLHVGAYSYASRWGQYCLEVRVNPRDIVSVPTDSSYQKVRTCRYTVIQEIEKKYDEPLLGADDYYDDDDESDWL